MHRQKVVDALHMLGDTAVVAGDELSEWLEDSVRVISHPVIDSYRKSPCNRVPAVPREWQAADPMPWHQPQLDALSFHTNGPQVITVLSMAGYSIAHVSAM